MMINRPPWVYTEHNHRKLFREMGDQQLKEHMDFLADVGPLYYSHAIYQIREELDRRQLLRPAKSPGYSNPKELLKGANLQ